MPRVLVNIMSSDWSVHFIGPDGQTRIGPWLLLDSHDEIRAILRWGDISDEEMRVHETSMQAWGVSSVVLELSKEKIVTLIRRARGWPWNGYELRQMKAAGRYPCRRINLQSDADPMERTE